MGQRLISFKSDLGWRGKSWSSTSDRGERRFIKIENGYVHADGSEIRAMPGLATILDLTETNNEFGYARYTIDAVRPIFDTSPNETYQFGYYGGDSRQQTLYARAKPVHFHGFDQVGKELVVWGESRFREVPLYSSERAILTVTQVGVVGGVLVVDFSANIAANTASDALGASLNGAEGNEPFYIEGLAVTGDASFQTILDTLVNQKVHLASGVATDRVTFVTPLSNHAAVAVTAGTAHRVRPKRFEGYTAGETPYGLVYSSAIDDPDALTAWRVLDQPDLDVTVVDCFPSWVANRRRDFGDQRDASDVEGVFLGTSTARGRSRRESRPLPFRTNADAATDGIALAAPQYGCMFWLPLGVPTNPDNWPGSPDNNQGGIPLVANSQFDQPRALGIPKARLLECSITTAQSSPSESGFNFSVEAITGSPDFGFAPGTWTMAIAFEDSAMGWEGLASEPVEVTIPNNTYAYALVPHYEHPGYTMPECLADRVNVYLAGPDEDALVYYASFPLSQVTGVAVTAVNDTHFNASAVYGFIPQSPDNMAALFRKIQLPVLGSNSPIEDELEAEAERLAPQSAQMPRGADAVRYVRGVLFSGGQVGNTGGALQLWVSAASAVFDTTTSSDDPNGMIIRVHGDSLEQPNAEQDGIDSLGFDGLSWTTLGIAGRCFPPAYQGIEVVSKTLFPGGPSSVQVDKVMNRRAGSFLATGANQNAYHERLRLTRPLWDRTRIAGSPSSQIAVSKLDQSVYYKMFQGQLQVGDPGAPNRTNLVALQFIDPNRGDDITGIGNVAGIVIACTQRETYSFAWSRNPSAETANLISNQHGCIAANSMVEFDGGLAWLSERGPCAIGGGLQFVGQDIQEDFFGKERRYAFDSKGMMRHSWGCHDASRSLVLWGVRTINDQYFLEHEFDQVQFTDASDELKSRFPCDEIVVWSYRTNAFSTWRLPLRIFWARPIRTVDGETVIAVLAEDGRIYALLDEATDMIHPASNQGLHILEPTARGSATTTLPIPVQCAQDGDATTGRNRGDQSTTLFLRTGMLVEGFFNNELRWTTTISSITTTGTTGSVALTEAETWGLNSEGWTIRIGGRPRLTIIPTYIGGETMDTLSVQGIQMRYSLFGEGKAHVFAEFFKTDFVDRSEAKNVLATKSDEWVYLGASQAGQSALGFDEFRISNRRQIKGGQVDAPEVSCRITVTGDSQVRIADIALEVA